MAPCLADWMLSVGCDELARGSEIRPQKVPHGVDSVPMANGSRARSFDLQVRAGCTVFQRDEGVRLIDGNHWFSSVLPLVRNWNGAIRAGHPISRQRDVSTDEPI